MNKRHILPLLSVILLASCASEPELTQGNGPDGDGVICLRGAIEGLSESGTRAYYEPGTIESGTYYMTYPPIEDNSTFDVTDIEFNNGYGFPKTPRGKDLTWYEVGPLTYDENLTVFYIDNVPRPESNPNTTVVTFDENYHPFDAGVYDEEGGTNDLLWGYAHIPMFAARDQISIGIHHWLSRVNVVVTVDNSEDNIDKIDFSNASVKITNLALNPLSYDRTTGNLNLGNNPKKSDLELISNGNFRNVTDDELIEGISYYQSESYILPPQTLPVNNERPRLVIKANMQDGSERTYSGVLPRVMMINDVPANFAFEKEYNLTLRVTISGDKLAIAFMIATVQEWIDKGSFTLSSTQAGVYNDDQMAALIKAYKANNVLDMSYFGFLTSSEEWVFNIFQNMEIKLSDYAGAMATGTDFSFDLHGHTLTVINDDGSSYEYDEDTTPRASEVLYEIVRNGKLLQPGQPTEP